MSCYHSAVLEAPIETVWADIKDFHNMSWAKGVIETCEKVDQTSGLETGAKRLLNGGIHETLLEIDQDVYTFTYAITDGPEPISKNCVKDYTGTVGLTPITVGNKTLIEWSSIYESDKDDVVKEFCDPIYVALLKAMQNHFNQ